jgi:predicted metalloprotease with PDZ domain
VWKDKPTPYDEGRQANSKSTSFFYSLGINLDADGNVTSTRWDGPAFDAGIVNSAQIVAVNEIAYSADVLKDAITAAKGGREPLHLLVKRGQSFRIIHLDWHGGLRYPWLEKTGTGEGGLDRLLAPRSGVRRPN